MTIGKLGLIALALCATACSSTTNVMCTADMRPALILRLIDAQTQVVDATDATATARDGEYVTTFEVSESGPGGIITALRAADERAGTYTINVQKPGYAGWSKSGIRVKRDACHVQTVHVDAELTPVL